MHVVILGGAGLMGSGTVRDLVSDLSGGFDSLTVADVTLERAKELCEALGDGRLIPAAVDVADSASLMPLLENKSLCINAVPTMAGFQMAIFDACLSARVPYIDYGGLGVYTVKQKARHEDWCKADMTAVLSCGADPGMSNLICKAVAEQLDTIDKINLYWAATVIGPENPVLVPPYAVSTVLTEYGYSSKQFLNGHLQDVPAMSGVEVIDLPEPWGRTEFMHSPHSEPLTVPFAEGFADKGIQEFTWKLSLPKHEHDAWVGLMKAGFCDFQDPIEIRGISVEPGEFLAKLMDRNMERKADQIPDQDGHETHFAIGEGVKDGKKSRVQVTINSGPDPLYDDYIDACTSMNVSIAAQMLLRGEMKPGVWGPEEYFEVDPYFEELKKRHFQISRNCVDIT